MANFYKKRYMGDRVRFNLANPALGLRLYPPQSVEGAVVGMTENGEYTHVEVGGLGVLEVPTVILEDVTTTNQGDRKMPSFQNVWGSWEGDQAGPQHKCLDCGQVVEGLAGMQQHQCPKGDEQRPIFNPIGVGLGTLSEKHIEFFPPPHPKETLRRHGSVMPDWMLRDAKVFDPFVWYGECPKQNDRGEKVISYGVTSGGYDIRLAPEYKVYTDVYNQTIDPKNPREESFINKSGPSCVIPPNSYILGRSVEYISIPRDYIGLCWGKSTYARAGIIVNITPLEPGWEGELVIEIANGTRCPAVVYGGEGIAQVVLQRLEEACQMDYSQKPGAKYQWQKGITLART